MRTAVWTGAFLLRRVRGTLQQPTFRSAAAYTGKEKGLLFSSPFVTGASDEARIRFRTPRKQSFRGDPAPRDLKNPATPDFEVEAASSQ